MTSNDTFDRIKKQNDALWTLLTSHDEQQRRAAFREAFGVDADQAEQQSKEEQK